MNICDKLLELTSQPKFAELPKGTQNWLIMVTGVCAFIETMHEYAKNQMPHRPVNNKTEPNSPIQKP